MIIEKKFTVTQFLTDLGSGYTWLKADNLGYGSIEEKYDLTINQIDEIKTYEKLKNAETTATIIIIIDDTKEGYVQDIIPQLPIKEIIPKMKYSIPEIQIEKSELIIEELIDPGAAFNNI